MIQDVLVCGQKQCALINPKSEVTDAKQTSRQQQCALNNTYQQQEDKQNSRN